MEEREIRNDQLVNDEFSESYEIGRDEYVDDNTIGYEKSNQFQRIT